MWCVVVSQIGTNILEELTSSILKKEAAGSPKHGYLCAKLCGITFQMTVILLQLSQYMEKHACCHRICSTHVLYTKYLL